jgi:hypothetical protein
MGTFPRSHHGVIGSLAVVGRAEHGKTSSISANTKDANAVITMRLRYRFHAVNNGILGNLPEIGGRKDRYFWRKLARLITLFDECSPATFSSGRNRRIL